jgi:hypothetical protein
VLLVDLGDVDRCAPGALVVNLTTALAHDTAGWFVWFVRASCA